jgi:hypothetical protein
MNRRGQTMVELALLLPLVIFFVATLVQFLLVVRIQVHLQQSVNRMVQSLAIGERAPTAFAREATTYPSGSRLGFLVPFPKIMKEPLRPWPAYPGNGTARTSGTLVSVELRYHLARRDLWAWMIPGGELRAWCALPKEPSVPEGGN